jgi:hypothetical protein
MSVGFIPTFIRAKLPTARPLFLPANAPMRVLQVFKLHHRLALLKRIPKRAQRQIYAIAGFHFVKAGLRDADELCGGATCAAAARVYVRGRSLFAKSHISV